MRNNTRPLGERVGRAVIIGVGLLGALAAFDALLLFCFLLLAAVFVAPPGPYIGLVMFIAVPVTVVIGAALGWAGYSALVERSDTPHADAEASDRPATNGHHAHV